MHNGKSFELGISFKPYEKTYGRYGDGKYLKIREHGYDAVDYSIPDTNCRLYTLSEPELRQYLARERQLAEQAGIRFSQVHGPWQYPPQDDTPENRAERLEKMKRAVVVTALLGCENMVVHPIMPFGLEDLGTDREPETWELNLAHYRRLVAFAAQQGVTVCLENMPMREFSVAAPGKILELVKAIDAPNCKVCLDTGHMATLKGLFPAEEVRRLRGYLKVLHIHDNEGEWDQHLYPTRGKLNWPELVDALYEIGFDGVFSLETAPSAALDDAAFEREGRELNRLVKTLVER